MRKRKIVISLGVVGLLAAAVTMAAATAKPAQATPSKKSVCSSCHSGAPVGSVAATPSKTALAPGEAYTVNVAVALSASGSAGFWIVNNDASTPDPNIPGGPGASPLTANMTAPAAPGTYTYLVYGVRGKPNSGQTGTTVYSITVEAPAPPPPPPDPTPTPPPPPDPTPTPTPTSTPTPDPTPTPPTPTPDPTPTPVVDTMPPTTLAPHAASVRTGQVAKLRYQVIDPSPNSGTATVVVVIGTKAGKVVKTLRPGTRSVNTPQTVRYKVKLKKGTYVFTVTATDAAGNASTVNGSNKLVVKRASRAHD